MKSKSAFCIMRLEKGRERRRAKRAAQGKEGGTGYGERMKMHDNGERKENGRIWMTIDRNGEGWLWTRG